MHVRQLVKLMAVYQMDKGNFQHIQITKGKESSEISRIPKKCQDEDDDLFGMTRKSKLL